MTAHRSKLHNDPQGGPSSAQSVRRRIVAEARRRFFTQGFRIVTTDDLAMELGMSKKTLYTHFSSKTELLEAVVHDKFKAIDTDLDRITSAYVSDFQTCLNELLACLRSHLEEIQPAFFLDIRRSKPDMFALIETKRRDFIRQYFGKALDRGREAGVICTDVSGNFIIEILLGLVQAIVNPQKIEELGITLQTAHHTIIRVVLEGVMTEKGREKVCTLP